MKNLLVVIAVAVLAIVAIGAAVASGPAVDPQKPVIWQGKDFIETDTFPWNKIWKPFAASKGPVIWQGKDFIETKTDLWNKLRGSRSRQLQGADGGWRLDSAIGIPNMSKKVSWPVK